MPSRDGSKLPFWYAMIGIVVVDAVTKWLAVAQLSRIPVPIVGEWVTLQLVYNPGAAFGINVGAHSRWVFTTLALVALLVLGSMVRQTLPSQKARLLALGFVCGGAIGNLIDRLKNAQGVVDFIDVGIGSHRWPTFNVADMAVSCGAIGLALILWAEGRRQSPAVAEADNEETTPNTANASS
jgi:signal peptidase II